MAANDLAPNEREKSMVQLQDDLAVEILEMLGIDRQDLDLGTYTSIRAAIAHFSVELVTR